ncbi:MAG: transglutaminase-like domain-containing protein [Bacteroidales bacterium]
MISFSLIPYSSVGQTGPSPEAKTKKFSYPAELQTYVNPTDLCDSENPEILQTAAQLTENCKSPSEAAVKLFNFVRDECLFGLSEADEKASVTLNSRIGWCITKNNLMVAMLRSVGIPARYHQVSVNKISLKGIVSNMLYKMLPEVITIHPWCECYLDGKWLACDVTFDKQTYQAAIVKGFFPQGNISNIEWDGLTDSKWVSVFVLEDHGVHASYDDISRKVADENRKMGPKFMLRAITNRSNKKTAKFRERYAGNS